MNKLLNAGSYSTDDISNLFQVTGESNGIFNLRLSYRATIHSIFVIAVGKFEIGIADQIDDLTSDDVVTVLNDDSDYEVYPAINTENHVLTTETYGRHI